MISSKIASILESVRQSKEITISRVRISLSPIIAYLPLLHILSFP